MRESVKRHDEAKAAPVRQRLWWITAAPSVWALHFLACYLSAAVWCEKFSATATNRPLIWMVSAYTVVSIGLIAAIASLSYRNFREGSPPIPYDFDDPADRTHFLGFTAFLLSVLSFIATLFTALVFLIIRSCD